MEVIALAALLQPAEEFSLVLIRLPNVLTVSGRPRSEAGAIGDAKHLEVVGIQRWGPTLVPVM
jgi:hypothetical protein